jgi:hypothetical protein
MACIAAKAVNMLGIRTEVWNPGIDHPACTLHKPGKARLPALVAWRFEYEPQPFFDQILQLAAAQRRLRLGPAVKVIRHIDRGFQCSTLPLKPIKEMQNYPNTRRYGAFASRKLPLNVKGGSARWPMRLP